MGIGGKKISEYWPVIKFPFYVLIAYSVAGLIMAMWDVNLYMDIFGGWTGFGLSVVVFGYVGWSAVVDHKFKVSHAAWSGAVLGMIFGVVAAVISILTLFLAPGIIEATVNLAMASGAEGVTPEMIRTITIVGAFVGLVLGPIMNGLIGAGLAALGGLIGKKM